MTITFTPIGTISTPFEHRDEAPRKASGTHTVGRITLDEPYRDAIAGYDRETIKVIWYADRADRSVLVSDRGEDRGDLHDAIPGSAEPDSHH